MTSIHKQENIANRLYHFFCNIEDDLKPKIKEIITMASKNLVDLTTCLILTHEKITSEEFKHLDILNRLAQPIHKWHEDLISGALATRRNISRLMSDIKYLVGNIPEADDLFLELDTIAKPASENWTSKMSFKAGENLRKILLDLVLIVDPKISGSSKNTESDVSLINQRISEMTSSSKEFLSLHTFKTSIKELKEDEERVSKKRSHGSEQNLKVMTTKKKNSMYYDRSADFKDLEYIQEELKVKNLETIENIHQIQQLKNMKYIHQIEQSDYTAPEEDVYPISSVKNSNFVTTNLMEPETEISPVKLNPNIRKNKTEDKSVSGLTTKKNSNKKIRLSTNFGTNQTLNKEIREPSFPNSKPISGMVSCRSSKKSLKSNYDERMNMIESIQSQIMEHPPKINTDRGPLNEVYDTNGKERSRRSSTFDSGKFPPLCKSRVLNDSFKKSDVIPENYSDENINDSNYNFSQKSQKLVVPRLPIEQIQNQNQKKKEKENKFKKFQDEFKKVKKNPNENFSSGLNKDFNFSNHTFQGNSPLCSLGKLKNISKISSEQIKDASKDSIAENKKHQQSKNLAGKNNLFSINTSQALSTIRDETEHFMNTNRSISMTQEDSKFLNPKSPTIYNKSIHETNRDTSSGFEGDSTPDRVKIDGNNVFARSPLASKRRTKSRRKRGKFDIDRYMANRNSEVIHVGIKGSQKVEISSDGNYAFFGGEGLNVLEMKNGEYRMIKKDKKKSKKKNNLF